MPRHETGSVATAQAQLDDIGRQRTELAERRKEIDRRRGELAFDASTGDAAAARKLEALLAETLTLSHRADDLGAAAAEAQRRVDRAIVREQQAETLDRAREAQRLLPSLRKAGDRAAASLDSFLAEFGSLIRISSEIRNLGIGGFPSKDLFRISCVASLQQALYGFGLSTMPLQAPGKRRTLAEVLSGYADVYQVNIDRATGQSEEAAE